MNFRIDQGLLFFHARGPIGRALIRRDVRVGRGVLAIGLDEIRRRLPRAIGLILARVEARIAVSVEREIEGEEDQERDPDIGDELRDLLGQSELEQEGDHQPITA